MKNLHIPAFCVALLLSFTACNLDDILTNDHTIHVVADANAIVTPSTDQKVKHNSDLSISITPKAGCNIDSVLVDGVNIGVLKSYIFKNITTDHSITIKASTKVFYTITAVYDSTKGTVSPKYSTVEKGQSATFNITAVPGFLIESLKNDGKTLPAVGFYEVDNVSKDDTFEVSFKKDSIMWPLLNIVWQIDSTYVYTEENGMLRFHDSNWTQEFNSNGFITEVSDGNVVTTQYFIQKNATNITISMGQKVYTIETLNENKMILSFIKEIEKQKWWVVYSNKSYK